MRITFEQYLKMLERGERTWVSPVPGLYFGFCPMPSCGEWKPLLKYAWVPETGTVIQEDNDEPLFCKECANRAMYRGLYFGANASEAEIAEREKELAECEDSLAGLRSILSLVDLGMDGPEACDTLGY